MLVSPQWKGVIKQSSRISLERRSMTFYQDGRDGDSFLTHDSDYSPADGLFNLSKLLRVIQLFASDGYARC